MIFCYEKWQSLRTWVKANITIEPVIFAFVFTNFVANGAQQNTNILLHKICVDSVGYNRSVCKNHHNHPEAHYEVIKETNMYSLYMDFVGIIPAVIYVMIGGALSDTVRELLYRSPIWKSIWFLNSTVGENPWFWCHWLEPWLPTSLLYLLAFSLIQFHCLYFTLPKCGTCAGACRFTTWVYVATQLRILRNMTGKE